MTRTQKERIRRRLGELDKEAFRQGCLAVSADYGIEEFETGNIRLEARKKKIRRRIDDEKETD